MGPCSILHFSAAITAREQKTNIHCFGRAAGSGEFLGSLASGDTGSTSLGAGTSECSPCGNSGDSSQSASKCSARAVNPTVDVRTNESWFGDMSVTLVPQLPSLGAAAFSQPMLANSGCICSLYEAYRTNWPM